MLFCEEGRLVKVMLFREEGRLVKVMFFREEGRLVKVMQGGVCREIIRRHMYLIGIIVNIG